MGGGFPAQIYLNHIYAQTLQKLAQGDRAEFP
jgi:hypothetical protein